MSSAPIPVQLFNDSKATDPTLYEVSPFTLRDIEGINLTAQASVLQAARNAARGETDPQMRRDILDSAMRVSSSINIMDDAEDSQKHFRGAIGLARILVAAMRKHSPHITDDVIVDMLKDERNNMEFAFVYQFVLGRVEKRVEVKADKPNPTRRAAKKRPRRQRKS